MKSFVCFTVTGGQTVAFDWEEGDAISEFLLGQREAPNDNRTLQCVIPWYHGWSGRAWKTAGQGCYWCNSTRLLRMQRRKIWRVSSPAGSLCEESHRQQAVSAKSLIASRRVSSPAWPFMAHYHGKKTIFLWKNRLNERQKTLQSSNKYNQWLRIAHVTFLRSN